MQRKEFVRMCGMGCLGLVAGSALLQGCVSTRYIYANINGSFLEVPLLAFAEKEGDKIPLRRYVVVENDNLQYPIVVFFLGQQKYRALYMRCTHQGTELQVFGDRLQCPAHGSEFTSSGAVQNGPADKGLRSFPILVSDDKLKIDLS